MFAPVSVCYPLMPLACECYLADKVRRVKCATFQGDFMAWHSVSQAQKLTGKSRRTLYRDMASGRVSYRTNASGHRECETSELIRVYGPLADDGTEERHTVSQADGTAPGAEIMEELKALRQEVAELKTMLLRLEHKEGPTQQPVPPAQPAAPWWHIWKKKGN